MEKLINKVSGTVIGRYGLTEDVINLRLAGMSLSEITDIVNSKLPEGVTVTKTTVSNFFKALPEVQREIVKRNKKQMIKVVNNNLDIIHEIQQLFARTKRMLEEMELRAEDNDTIVSPYKFKAISSELRETLKLLMEVNKEINDLNNIKQFMAIVIEVIKEEAPQSIPIIIERLKLAKGTGWMSEVLRKADKNG